MPPPSEESRDVFYQVLRPLRWTIIVSPHALMGLLVASYGGSFQEQQGSRDEQGTEPITGEFTGGIPQAEAFVSLIAGESQGQGSEEREVRRAYLCATADS